MTLPNGKIGSHLTAAAFEMEPKPHRLRAQRHLEEGDVTHTAAENQMHSGMKLMRGMRHGDAGCVLVVHISKISEWQPGFKAARSS